MPKQWPSAYRASSCMPATSWMALAGALPEGDFASAPAAWAVLRSHLASMRTFNYFPRLLLAAADACLTAEQHFQLPPWLLSDFQVGHLMLSCLITNGGVKCTCR